MREKQTIKHIIVSKLFIFYNKKTSRIHSGRAARRNFYYVKTTIYPAFRTKKNGMKELYSINSTELKESEMKDEKYVKFNIVWFWASRSKRTKVA